MSSPAPLELGDALDALVDQFADPWSFLRELIQNAIDAGSLEIDVLLDHDPDQGMMTIEVVDNGEGMDREIIDARLTRLFSSAKDGDYTKIGRFGIGFVSVFAIEPELVCVDTARAGEHWRVLFKKDRSFERILDAVDEARGETVGTSRKLIRFVTDRPGHDFRYAIDTTYIGKTLGWKPRMSLDDGLRATVRWYLDHAEWCERARTGAHKEFEALWYGNRL